jgi:SapC protein
MTKATSGQVQPPADAAAAPSGMPLFFKDPRPLDSARHAKAAVRTHTDFAFAREANSLPLNVIEFIEASKAYPIVFTSDAAPMPAAVVGLEKGNYFVTADGTWQADNYIPAYARQYPFVFLEAPEAKKFYLCIDEGSALYHASGAEGANPLYTNEGKPSDITAGALQFCTAFYNHYTITKNFCADLKTHNLLMPYQSETKLASGRQINLAGFFMIDEKALNALPEKTFLEFRGKGWLPFIYLALASASNWKRLANLAHTADNAQAA